MVLGELLNLRCNTSGFHLFVLCCNLLETKLGKRLRVYRPTRHLRGHAWHAWWHARKAIRKARKASKTS